MDYTLTNGPSKDELDYVTLDPSRLKNPITSTLLGLTISAIVGYIIGVAIIMGTAMLALSGPMAIFSFPLLLAVYGTQLAVGFVVIIVVVWVGGYVLAKLASMSEGLGSMAGAMKVQLLPLDDPIVVDVHKMCERLKISPVQHVGWYESDEINAFAIGLNPENAMVAFSRGCIGKLTGDQFMAVMGHELAHVANKDMARMTYARGIQTALTFFLVVRGLQKAVRWVFTPFSEIFIMRLSRKREYYADAVGAMMVSPKDMIGALEAIAEDTAKPPKHQKPYANMMFKGVMSGLFRTHPPLKERIYALSRREYMHRLPIMSSLLDEG